MNKSMIDKTLSEIRWEFDTLRIENTTVDDYKQSVSNLRLLCDCLDIVTDKLEKLKGEIDEDEY